jgi:hypothetical protein
MVAQTYTLWKEDNDIVRAYLALPNWLRNLANFITRNLK